jgi:alkylated DNA repair dioxygenase AlkB
MPSQIHIFETEEQNNPSKLLEGIRYQEDFITPADEESLVARVRELPFREFEFHGYFGKRRVVSFGWRYEFSGGGKLQKAEDIPKFFLPLRSLAASFAGLEPEELQHVLVSEYAAGAGIGWHRDKAVFGQVVGVSLLTPCVLRFRRKVAIDDASAKQSWERVNFQAEPRSAYHLTGPARLEWQHSILRVDALRYSITFRSMKENAEGVREF